MNQIQHPIDRIAGTIDRLFEVKTTGGDTAVIDGAIKLLDDLFDYIIISENESAQKFYELEQKVKLLLEKKVEDYWEFDKLVCK